MPSFGHRKAPAPSPSRRLGILRLRDAGALGAPFPYKPIIPDDANTVFHLVVKNGIIYDPFAFKGPIPETGGSLTRVAAQSMGFPNGKSAEGITGFSATKYLSIPNPTLNFAGPFYMTILAKTGSTLGAINSMEIVGSSTGSAGTAKGYDFAFDTNAYQSQSPWWWDPSSGASVGGLFTSAANAIMILSGGATGATSAAHLLSKMNTTAAIDAGSISPGTHQVSTAATRIGYGAQSTWPNGTAIVAFDGTIFEIMATTTVPTTTILNNLHTAIRNNP